MQTLDNPHILIIDPDPLSLAATAAILHCHNFQVHQAQDWQAAVRGVNSLQLDLILCDERIETPGQKSLIDWLQEHPEKSDVPVMFMSIHQLPDVIHRSHGASSAYHLRKPVEPKVLISLVDRALWQLPLINHRVRQPHFQLPHLNADWVHVAVTNQTAR